MSMVRERDELIRVTQERDELARQLEDARRLAAQYEGIIAEYRRADPGYRRASLVVLDPKVRR